MSSKQTESDQVIKTMELIGHGSISWSEVRRLAEHCQAAWADYDGFHVGELPAMCPAYSHIWAWPASPEGKQRWLRIRPTGDLDGERDAKAIVSELGACPSGTPTGSGEADPSSSEESTPDGEDERVEREYVEVRIKDGRLWPPGDSRVSPKGDDLTEKRDDGTALYDRGVHVLEVLPGLGRHAEASGDAHGHAAARGSAPITFMHAGPLPDELNGTR